jgi:ATP-dependent 26S proteasome regulatory subunit
MRSELQRLTHEQTTMQEKIRDNGEKIKQNKVLPYLVGNVVEVSCPIMEMEQALTMYGYANRFLIWILMQKKMERTKIWILCEKGNAPL